MRLAEAQVPLPIVGDIALRLQERGNLALSTKLSRAVTEGAIAVELNQAEREAVVEALADGPPPLSRVRDRLAHRNETVATE